MAEENKSETKTETKRNNYTWVEVVQNIKFGDKVYKIGEKIQLPPIHANTLAKEGYVKK